MLGISYALKNNLISKRKQHLNSGFSIPKTCEFLYNLKVLKISKNIIDKYECPFQNDFRFSKMFIHFFFCK